MAFSPVLYSGSGVTVPCILRRHTFSSPCISYPAFRAALNIVLYWVKFTSLHVLLRVQLSICCFCYVVNTLELRLVLPCVWYSLAVLVTLIDMFTDLCFVALDGARPSTWPSPSTECLFVLVPQHYLLRS
ncbi:hypothetical protein CPB86DRAFT_316036 [Serendipita vermifera]|nr:hypothetical protein CPB86DRAFT_316036 [Serendipita vermifera]